jgi:hypothetical protein
MSAECIEEFVEVGLQLYQPLSALLSRMGFVISWWKFDVPMQRMLGFNKRGIELRFARVPNGKRKLMIETPLNG